MSNEKHYSERDIIALDQYDNLYCKHVSAMTRELLHSKSNIAAELAHRDYLICELRKALFKAATIIDDTDGLVHDVDMLAISEELRMVASEGIV